MLQKELNSFLTDTLGVDLEKLKEGLTSEDEVAVEFKPLSIMSDEDLDGVKTKVKKDGYEEGKIAGVEMSIKESKEKFGLEFDGKSMANFADALKTKVIADAKIEPNKKITDLNHSLENLQKQYKTDIELKDGEIGRFQKTIDEYKINGDIARYLPDGLKGINTNQFSLLSRNEFGFSYEEGTFVVSKDGTILRDKLEKPLPVKDVLTTYAKKNGWVKTEGRGGDDSNGYADGFKTLNDVYKHMETNKIDPLLPEGQKLVADFNNQKE